MEGEAGDKAGPADRDTIAGVADGGANREREGCGQVRQRVDRVCGELGPVEPVQQ